MKKVISALLVIVMCLSFMSTFAFALQFSDVSSTAWYYNAVQWAVEKGVTNGTTATTFAPKMTCDRSQAVTFMWNAAGKPEPTSTNNPFTDVKTTAWYYKAILWAVEKGITNGTTATTFSPTMKCDRSQIVTFLWKSAGKPAPKNSTNPFTDVKDTSWYYQAILWAVENKVTNGTSATTFSPTMTCDRSQIVTFLYNYFKNQTPPTPPTPDTPCTHIYDNECDTTCNKCGVERVAPHKYDYDCDKECNLCGAKRDVKHTYPSNPNGTYQNCACGAKHISIPGPITTDKEFVAAGETITASVTAQNGLAPYTFKWQYKNATGWHTIEGKTTATVTFTVTNDMFDANKKLVLYVNASDAEGYTASPMNYKEIGALGLLEVSFNEIAQIDDYMFMSRPGSSELLGVLPVYINVKNADPNKCTYKWEYSRKKDSDFKEIPTDSAGFNTHGINYTDPNYDAPAFMIKKSFLDTPVYIRVTVTSLDNQTVTVVSGVVCRELNGSTGSANFLTGTTDPMFVVTPKGGNGSYGYTWGFTYAGGGGTYTFKSQISDSYYDGENTNSLTIDRAWFNSHKNQFESFYCTIGSNGKAETVTIPIS